MTPSGLLLVHMSDSWNSSRSLRARDVGKQQEERSVCYARMGEARPMTRVLPVAWRPGLERGGPSRIRFMCSHMLSTSIIELLRSVPSVSSFAVPSFV